MNKIKLYVGALTIVTIFPNIHAFAKCLRNPVEAN